MATEGVGIARNQKVYGKNVHLVPPVGRKRKLAPDQEPQAAEDVLAALPWRQVTWRQGTKGKLQARFAAVRVRGRWRRVGQQPAPAEAAVGRFKQVIGDGLRSRTDRRRTTEADVAVHVLNRMLDLGRPISVRIA